MIPAMTPNDRLEPVADPDAVLDVLTEHRAIHTYGIIDVVQFWETSRWWVRDRGAVGLVGLPRVPDQVVYAVSAVHAAATLALLIDLVDDLPDRFAATGPSGMAERLAATHTANRVAPYVKMQLIRPDRLPDPGSGVRLLEPADGDACTALLEQTSGSPEFFRHDLLGTGRHTGIFDGDALVAMAGTHVIDTEQGLAAIGNVNTLPEYRGRGLARRVVAALARRLREEVDIVALNVARDNAPARNLYEGLGFLPLMEYQEAELVRR